MDEDELLAFLKKRQGLLDGVAVTGEMCIRDRVKALAAQELSAIYAAQDIAPCAVTEDLLD